MCNEELELVILKNVESMRSQRSLADTVGFSVGKVNYVIKALADKGLLKTEHFLNSPDKHRYTYLLTDEGIKEKIALTQKFIKQKKAEYEQLQRELDADCKIINLRITK